MSNSQPQTPQRRVPTSTYRLQLTPEFGFAAAAAQLPYLAQLGVDWVYLSPVLQSTSGSQHGYDVVDPTRVDAARGGRDAFVALCNRAHELGLGVLVDIVPNHMGVGVPRENPWWWDVLQHGQASRYARYFDIDWDAGDGRVLIPIIGDDDMPDGPGEPMKHVTVDAEAGVLRYWDLEFPLAPGTDTSDVRRAHASQHYRLAHWRLGDHALNYRRFFTVTSLAGLRVELDEVWEAAHAEILSWVAAGLVDGLRIDHPDGLRDPAGYLAKLRERTGGIYTVVEKILEPGESLPDWACDGTTGYDALAVTERLCIDADGALDLEQAAAALSSRDLDDWSTLIHESKRSVADHSLQAELRRVARELGSEDDRTVDALTEIAANFSVYRTYLPHGSAVLQQAAIDAADWRPDLASEIERILPTLSDPAHPAAQRWQQTTGMIMAKAVEDRAFYRYSRLTSLNEVGGDPTHLPTAIADFHAAQLARQAHWPLTQTALTTHDTKRSEDTRARIDVLSEMPDEWSDALHDLLEISPIANPAFANLLWQGVIGSWPASRERLHDYAIKAARESGEITTWTAVNDDYEASLRAAVDSAFDHPAARAIIARLHEQITPYGYRNSIVMKAAQLFAPGVPDVYQGTELWDRSLVDPDNRRPVDWWARQAALDAIGRGARPELDETGATKLMVVTAALRMRRKLPDRFTRYTPLKVQGPASDHALAFDRGGIALVAAIRTMGLEAGGGWHDTSVTLPVGTWVDQLTGRSFQGQVPLAGMLDNLPVALLLQC